MFLAKTFYLTFLGVMFLKITFFDVQFFDVTISYVEFLEENPFYVMLTVLIFFDVFFGACI